jgi:hypothetical protein
VSGWALRITTLNELPAVPVLGESVTIAPVLGMSVPRLSAQPLMPASELDGLKTNVAPMIAMRSAMTATSSQLGARICKRC